MKEANKKIIIIIAAVGLLFAIAVAMAALFFIFYNPYPDKIVSALSSGRYDMAIQEYNEKYSNKTPDKKLIAALTNRLNNISILFAKEKIDYKSTKEEIYTIDKMNIAEIKALLNKSEDTVENIQIGKKSYALANKYYANNDYFLAITEYKKTTNTDDCNYFEAKTKLDECISAYKKEVLTKIDTLYQNKNIADALIMLQEALTIIPDDVELSAKKEALILLRQEKENEESQAVINPTRPPAVQASFSLGSACGHVKIAYTTPNHAGLNLRSEPSSQSKLIMLKDEGETLFYSGQERAGYAYCETEEGFSGWVMSKYLIRLNGGPGSCYGEIFSYILSNTPDHAGVNVRAEPSSNSQCIKTIPEGTTVFMTPSKKNGYIYCRVVSGGNMFYGWIIEAYLYNF